MIYFFIFYFLAVFRPMQIYTKFNKFKNADLQYK